MSFFDEMGTFWTVLVFFLYKIVILCVSVINGITIG
jgi:hypothetical protein